MKKQLRKQDDAMGDAYSDLTGISFLDTKDLARQEFKDEADVNVLLRKFGVGVPQKPNPVFGDVDYTVDLQSALTAAREASFAWSKLPMTIRTKYRNWSGVLDAIERGALKVDQLQEKPPEPKPEDTPTPPPPTS